MVDEAKAVDVGFEVAGTPFRTAAMGNHGRR